MEPKPISRRTLVTAASIVPLGAVRGSAANSAVSVGLIGCGGRGTFDIGLMAKIDGARVIVQCKAHRKPVSPSVARELYGTLLSSKAKSAILASVSGFGSTFTVRSVSAASVPHDPVISLERS